MATLAARITLNKIYNVSGGSNNHRSFVLNNESDLTTLTEADWGKSLICNWKPVELIATEDTKHLKVSDFSAVYIPGSLLTSDPMAKRISFPELECLPVYVNNEQRILLNPLITITKFREENADFVRVPSGAVILLYSADFYASDIPSHPALFWYHDGNAARFLLCNESFYLNLVEMGVTGLSFQYLGHAW